MMISICLSEISIPCNLYTCCTSFKIYFSTASADATDNNSFGEIEPSVILSPGSTISPSETATFAPIGVK